MKVQLVSDLHLENTSNFQYVMDSFKPEVADWLVMAGNICTYFNNDQPLIDFLQKYQKKFDKIIYVLGNFEFYLSDIKKHQTKMQYYYERINNCEIVNNHTIKSEKAFFICSTLWSNHDRHCNDIRHIPNMKTEYIREANDYCRKYIQRELKEHQMGYKIVATHHIPHPELSDKYIDNSPVKETFISDQSDLFTSYRIHYWLHGHTHTTIDKKVERTHCIRNPMGLATNLLKEINDISERKTFDLK